MADNSPTDTTPDASGSNTDLPENQEDHSAEEQHDTVSSDTQDADHASDDSAANASTDSDDSSDDDGLKRFAKSQGFDPDNLTDTERRALKIAHDNQKAYRKKEEAGNKLSETLDQAYGVSEEELAYEDPADAEQIKFRAEVATLRAENRMNRFYKTVPEAADYEDGMRDVLLDIIKEEGAEAARSFTASEKGLRRLYNLAKAEAGEGSDARVRRETLEEVRRKQEASADSGHATSPAGRKTPKVTRAWVQSEYDPSNPEHRQMLDEAISNGTYAR